VNNYGAFGVDDSAAIINHPKVAIPGISRIFARPWIVGGEVEPPADNGVSCLSRRFNPVFLISQRTFVIMWQLSQVGNLMTLPQSRESQETERPGYHSQPYRDYLQEVRSQ
jgi:hypothetical protein